MVVAIKSFCTLLYCEEAQTIVPQKSDVLESKCVYYCLHAHLFSLPTQTWLMHKRKCVQTDSLWLLVDRFFFYSAEFVLFESVLGNILHIVLQPSIAEERRLLL